MVNNFALLGFELVRFYARRAAMSQSFSEESGRKWKKQNREEWLFRFNFIELYGGRRSVVPRSNLLSLGGRVLDVH